MCCSKTDKTVLFFYHSTQLTWQQYFTFLCIPKKATLHYVNLNCFICHSAIPTHKREFYAAFSRNKLSFIKETSLPFQFKSCCSSQYGMLVVDSYWETWTVFMFLSIPVRLDCSHLQSMKLLNVKQELKRTEDSIYSHNKPFITLFIEAFGKADLLYISYLSNCSSVKFDTSTL
jgi:hypothetical protein